MTASPSTGSTETARRGKTRYSVGNSCGWSSFLAFLNAYKNILSYNSQPRQGAWCTSTPLSITYYNWKYLWHLLRAPKLNCLRSANVQLTLYYEHINWLCPAPCGIANTVTHHIAILSLRPILLGILKKYFTLSCIALRVDRSAMLLRLNFTSLLYSRGKP